jgi:predicted small metal-binding protein
MVQEFSCKDAGVATCPFMVRDENIDELVNIVQRHASMCHNEALDKEDVLKHTRYSSFLSAKVLSFALSASSLSSLSSTYSYSSEYAGPMVIKLLL